MSTAPNTDGALAGRRILVTRAAGQAEALAKALAARGAQVIPCPVLRIEAAVTTAELPALDSYRWLVFTSRNAVNVMRELLSSSGAEPILPPDLQVAVVGPGTAAAVATLGRQPDLVAEPATGAGLVATFAAFGLPTGTPVLRVRGDLAPPDVEVALERFGAVVDVLTAYRTVTVAPPEAAMAVVRSGQVDAVTFYSGSAVDGFETGVPGHGLHDTVLAACVGPVTAAAAAAAGWHRIVTSDQPAADDVAAALAAALASSGR